MPPSHLPYGLYAAGVYVPNSPLFNMGGGNHYFVHGNTGNNGNSGLGWDSPWKTMAYAFSRLASGDVVHVKGNITEQLSTPAGIFDVTILGEGNRPRNADAHTSNNGYQAATWKGPAAPAAATPLCTVRQQGWRFVNILFNPPADAAALSFMRNALAGDAERDSGHAEVLNCRFTGGLRGIQIIGPENVFDVLVAGNTFTDHTGHAIYSANPYAWRWNIQNNVFLANANHIIAGLTQSQILNNVFGKFTTYAIDLNGGGGDNVIFGNQLTGVYAVGQYRKAAGSDEWGGNYGVAGLTSADPA